MPIYEYACLECDNIFEEWQKDFKEREMVCPQCGGKAKRMISHSSFILKGSGWYVTDYAHKSSSPAKTGNGSNGNGQSKDTAKTKVKPAASSTSKSTGKST